jgi:hypothetical protein
MIDQTGIPIAGPHSRGILKQMAEAVEPVRLFLHNPNRLQLPDQPTEHHVKVSLDVRVGCRVLYQLTMPDGHPQP